MLTEELNKEAILSNLCDSGAWKFLENQSFKAMPRRRIVSYKESEAHDFQECVCVCLCLCACLPVCLRVNKL